MSSTSLANGFDAQTRSVGRGSRAPSAARTDIIAPDESRALERFVPVTRFALMDRLAQPAAWPLGEAAQARRFFAYLDYWRQQQYNAQLLDLEQDYEPFSPDTDLLLTRAFSTEEKVVMQRRVVDRMQATLRQANYEAIDPGDVARILTKDSHYGLDLSVDLDAFEELLIYYRGASSRKSERRVLRKFLRKQEFQVPIFQRFFVLFKLKSDERRIEELVAQRKCTRREAEKTVAKLRAKLPPSVSSDNIYMKLFKNLPRSDIEMAFPNTQVRFRLMDKLKLGVTTGGAFGLGAFGAAGKLALALSNPVAAAGAVATLGGIAFRQGMNFLNQRQRYMVVMAQNLYFHSMADNRGVMIKLADRAAEEDVKEELLLYTVLVKERVHRSRLKSVDRGIEAWLKSSFGIEVDFDVEDALGRLLKDGIVVEDSDGYLSALRPADACAHLDGKWDRFLDDLTVPTRVEGVEMDGALIGQRGAASQGLNTEALPAA